MLNFKRLTYGMLMALLVGVALCSCSSKDDPNGEVVYGSWTCTKYQQQVNESGKVVYDNTINPEGHNALDLKKDGTFSVVYKDRSYGGTYKRNGNLIKFDQTDSGQEDAITYTIERVTNTTLELSHISVVEEENENDDTVVSRVITSTISFVKKQ